MTRFSTASFAIAGAVAALVTVGLPTVALTQGKADTAAVEKPAALRATDDFIDGRALPTAPPGEPCVKSTTLPVTLINTVSDIAGVLPVEAASKVNIAGLRICSLLGGFSPALVMANGVFVYYEPDSFEGDTRTWFEGMARTWGGKVISVDGHLGYFDPADEAGILHEALFVHNGTVIRVQAPHSVAVEEVEKVVNSFTFPRLAGS